MGPKGNWISRTFVEDFFWMPSLVWRWTRWTDFSEESNAKKPKGAN